MQTIFEILNKDVVFEVDNQFFIDFGAANYFAQSIGKEVKTLKNDKTSDIKLEGNQLEVEVIETASKNKNNKK